MLTYKPKVKPEKSELKKLEDKLWKVFSEYIRLRDSDENGYIVCFTCSAVQHFTNMDAGHAIGGRGNAILFSEEGCKPQCRNCNQFLGGNYKVFRQNLGEETYQKLLAESKQAQEFTPSLLKNNIDYYTAEVKRLREEKGMI